MIDTAAAQVKKIAKQYQIVVPEIGALHFEIEKYQLSYTRDDSSLHIEMQERSTYWKGFGFRPVSSLDAMLDRENYTLEDLLDEEETIREVTLKNKRLIDL